MRRILTASGADGAARASAVPLRAHTHQNEYNGTVHKRTHRRAHAPAHTRTQSHTSTRTYIFKTRTHTHTHSRAQHTHIHFYTHKFKRFAIPSVDADAFLGPRHQPEQWRPRPGRQRPRQWRQRPGRPGRQRPRRWSQRLHFFYVGIIVCFWFVVFFLNPTYSDETNFAREPL